MKSLRFLGILGLFGAILLLGACAPEARPAPVVATFSILGDWVQNVAGDRLQVLTLVGPDSDAHNYEPSPRDQARLAEAGLIFEIGLEFEGWLDKAFEASASKARRIAVSEGFELIKAEEPHDEDEHHDDDEEHDEDEHHDDDEDHDEDEHHHGESDPHIWQSVAGAQHALQRIYEALAAYDPEGAEVYRENALRYSQSLTELDAWIRSQAALIPEGRRVLVTNHDTFAYFARDYGFTLAGSLLGASTEGAAPAARALADLITLLRRQGVPAVFAENISESSTLAQAAQEAGVRLAPSLFSDALGAQDSPGATYLDMVRWNVGTIVSALKGE